ncbi:MAG TPA: hypothetical protein PKN75_07990 [Bacteroidia bacterium]|nr:hypothetical protein [Bacteroidia bacterium]HNU33517.1 hypothetical protein [Bacteroidia bacterium]
MPKLLIENSNKFMLPPHPIHMHDDVVNWISELEFCKIELLFFRKLLKQSVIVTKSKKRLNAYYSLELKLKKFDTVNLKKILGDIRLHEHNLSEAERSKIIVNEKSINKAHQKIRLNIEEFTGSIRKLKKELFTFIENQHKISVN